MTVTEHDPVELLHTDFCIIKAILTDQGEISLLTTIERIFKNNIILASASNSEKTITAFMQSLFEDNGLKKHIATFCKKSAFDQKYHTFFEWGEAEKATPEKGFNKFISQFGPEFKQWLTTQTIDEDKQGMGCFIQIGYYRNCMVHTGFYNYATEQTTDEILEKHRKIRLFLDRLLPNIKSYNPTESETVDNR